MVRTTKAAVLACVLAALVLSGCGSAKDSGKPVAGPTATSNGPGSHTSVIVDSAGAEPRQKLRFALHQGASQHATMTMQMGMALTVNGRTAPTNTVPPMQMGMAVTIPEVADNGNITATFHYDRIRVLGRGMGADRLKANLAPLSQVYGTIRTTNTGRLIDSDLSIPGAINPILKSVLDSVKEQLGNMMVPLPDEPVGVGATWTVHTEAALVGITASVDYHYRLVERAGTRLVLTGSYVESVAEQDAHLPTMPAGAKTHVYGTTITGSGRTVLDLGSLFPVESTVETRGPVHMLVTQGSDKTDLVQRMHMRMQLAR